MKMIALKDALPLSLLLIISLILASSSLTSASCNGTIAECGAEETEFMMESDISRRVLAGQRAPTTDYSKLPGNNIGANCGRPKYASCTPNKNNKIVNGRCLTFNKCRVGNQ